MNVIIVGCGRVGSHLATLLSADGHNVYVIDKSDNAFNELGRDYNGNTVKGSGYDEEVLRAANVEHCDALAAVTNNDNVNMMVACVARDIFGVKHVITRLFNPNREKTYMKLDIDFSCGTTLVAEEIFAKMLAGHGHHIDTFGDYEVMCITVALGEDESVSCISLEREFNARVIVIERDEETFLPKAETQLYDGDVILVCVDSEKLTDFSELIRKKNANRNQWRQHYC